jgi:hypothetical protein
MLNAKLVSREYNEIKDPGAIVGVRSEIGIIHLDNVKDERQRKQIFYFLCITVCVCVCERERERERGTKRERERDILTRNYRIAG